MLELIRYANGAGTPGTLRIGDRVVHTLEQPYLDNKPFKSCVSVGEYVLLPYDSPKYGECFIMVNPDLNVYQFEDSPRRPPVGRYLCLFVHKGNYVRNFQGCIGAGKTYIQNHDMITATKSTCERVNRYVAVEGSFKLLIRNREMIL